MSLAIACLLSLTLAVASAEPSPVHVVRAGTALDLKWELPDSRSDEPFEAICTFWPEKEGKPSVGFKIVRKPCAAISFHNDPFGHRIWALDAPGDMGHLVTRIFPVRARDAGKYVCVLTTECCATPAWTHQLSVFRRRRSVIEKERA